MHGERHSITNPRPGCRCAPYASKRGGSLGESATPGPGSVSQMPCTVAAPRSRSVIDIVAPRSWWTLRDGNPLPDGFGGADPRSVGRGVVQAVCRIGHCQPRDPRLRWRCAWRPEINSSSTDNWRSCCRTTLRRARRWWILLALASTRDWPGCGSPTVTGAWECTRRFKST